jgi:acyl carrier protein|tara:strand:+ start:416 stop:676 length:261 start_codon:yes stop_codon:yes gene_type:complete
MSKEVYDAIIGLLEKRGPVPEGSEKERREYHYLDAGHLDSFNTIQFILEVEELFNITLTPKDTTSDKFRTVNGLIQIVEEKHKTVL